MKAIAVIHFSDNQKMFALYDVEQKKLVRHIFSDKHDAADHLDSGISRLMTEDFSDAMAADVLIDNRLFLTTTVSRKQKFIIGPVTRKNPKAWKEERAAVSL